MGRGPAKKRQVEPGKEHSLLSEPWPWTGKEDRKVIWHFKQFYALRMLAIQAENLTEARQNQQMMYKIDSDWAEKVVPRALPERSGKPEEDAVLTEILPRELPVPHPASRAEALDMALERSRSGEKTGGDDDTEPMG